MAKAPKPQRIRDPLHNLIPFGSDQFEHCLWKVVQTRPFQRLRRVKQLGFSEFVYPGATHTRFSHCVGVFHTARQLMEIIERHIKSGGQQVKTHQLQLALAGALVHDLGHGMFSHAFEDVGRALDLKYARHEHVSDALIRSGEVAEALGDLGTSFADEVATLINQRGPETLYDAVVSSQFDADRLDYMRRDSLMAGVQNGGIDFTWLVANLEVGTLPRGVDEKKLGDLETFVLGPKAMQAAETFVLSLFQLYPSLYFHKATRGAEKVFTALILRLIRLAQDGQSTKAGLPDFHPIIKFARDPNNLENVLNLDDAVFWGALPMLCDSADEGVRHLALSLRDRRLLKCRDVRNFLIAELGVRPADAAGKKAWETKMARIEELIIERSREWSDKHSKAAPRILIDQEERDPYKRFQESKGPLNQIRMRTSSGKILDVAECSPVVAALETFKLCRLYAAAGDSEAMEAIEQIAGSTLKENQGAD